MVTERELRELPYSTWMHVINSHIRWSRENNRISNTPKPFTEPGTLNIIGIRNNDERDFTYGKFNDFLILILNKEDGKYEVSFTPCSVDPSAFYDGKGNPIGRAHQRQGAWDSYLIRRHNHANQYFPQLRKTIGRWAACQDRGPTQVIRTNGKGLPLKDKNGNVISYVVPNTINIHNGITSWGCTTIPDKYYVEFVLPYFYDLKKGKAVPENPLTYVLINKDNLAIYLNEPVQATSLKGEWIESFGAKRAIKDAKNFLF